MEVFIDNEIYTRVTGADGIPIMTDTEDFLFSRNSGTYCCRDSTIQSQNRTINNIVIFQPFSTENVLNKYVS